MTYTLHLDDPAWRIGENEDALFAVVAWTREALKSHAMHTVNIPNDLHAMLKAAGQRLNAKIGAYEAESAAVEQRNRASRLERLATGAPPEPVPPALTLRSLIDPDAVARFLVGHGAQRWLTVGRWYKTEVRNEAYKVVGDRLDYSEAPDWSAIQERCSRWGLWTRLQAYPSVAEKHGIALLTELKNKLRAELQEELLEEWERWTLKAPQPAPLYEPRTLDDSEDNKEVDDEDVDDADDQPSPAARRASERFRSYIINHPGCSNNDLRGLKGGKHWLEKGLDILFQEGAIKDQGTDERHAYYPLAHPISRAS